MLLIEGDHPVYAAPAIHLAANPVARRRLAHEGIAIVGNLRGFRAGGARPTDPDEL
jgi:hypothetical protein